MKSKQIDKAIEIINYAIQNQITVTEASVKCGFAYTYVKNVKAQVYENYGIGNLTDELFKKFVKAYERYQEEGLEWSKPSRKTNNDFTKVSDPTKEKEHFVRTEHIGNRQPLDLPKTNESERLFLNVDEDKEQAEVTWVSGANYPKDHVKTLDELLAATKVDLDIWKVREYWINKWDVTSWKQKFPQTVQNWQVKARLEKDVKLSEALDIEKIFKRMITDYKVPQVPFYKKDNADTDENNLLELAIFDLHMGKLAWGGETGESYDTKIARERFIYAINDLLILANRFPYSRILFPVGNDFFNSDTIFNTTTQGTPQDEDLRWQKTFNVGVRLLIDGINLLKRMGKPIDVLVIPGNHDFERSFYMGKYLEAWFNNDPVVCINTGASPRKYYKFGKVLLGFTHGSEEKEGSLPMIMANDIESKPMWSETLYHEFHVGHIHRKRDMKYSATLDKIRVLNEDLGVTVRYLSSLTGTEEWHHKKGFVGAVKAADGFIWNDEKGLLAHINSNLKV
jgi:hypothetical protein